MRILKDINREGLFQLELPKEIVRMNFLLHQIDILEKESLLFQQLNMSGMVPLPVSGEEEVIRWTESLLKSLKLQMDLNAKVFRNTKNQRYFLVAREDRFIQVDTAVLGLTDETESLFWRNHYNLKKPEISQREFYIKTYLDIFLKLDHFLNFFREYSNKPLKLYSKEI